MPTNSLLGSALVVGLGALASGAAAFSPVPTVAIAAAESQREANKRLVTVFHEETFGRKTANMIHQVIAPNLIQHDPVIEDGRAGLLKYHHQLITRYPNYSAEIRRITASGDLVTVHVLERLNPWDRGNVQIHMYRVSPFAITEHWVVVNPIPATSLNANGLI
jgi:predicted SnoaL-like aldol condensation-catalyzing enzyme